MTSEEEMGVYGKTRRVKDWDKYNPMKIKVIPFPEEYMCPLCEEKKEYVFPVTLELCETCAMKVMERKDCYRMYVKTKIDFEKFGLYCHACGKSVPKVHVINTRVCQKCTVKLGKEQKRYQGLLKYARKVI